MLRTYKSIPLEQRRYITQEPEHFHYAASPQRGSASESFCDAVSVSFGRTCASTFDRRDKAGPGWREEARRTRQVPVGSYAVRGSSKQPDCGRRLFHRRHVVDPCCFDANPLWCNGSKETG